MISSFNIEKLTSLLKDFYTVTGIRITVFDESFTEIAAWPEDRADFCRLVRTDPAAEAECIRCDKAACKIAAKKHGTHIYECHAGLKEAIMPIYLDTLLVGYLFFGHVFGYGSYEEGWKKIEEKCGGYNVRLPDLKAASLHQPLISEDYLLSAANLMNAIATYLCMERMAVIRQEDLPVRIDRYIDGHLAEPLDSEGICSVFGIGRTKLYEISRQSYGMGIAELIRKKRIDLAKKRLAENPSVSIRELASECGFDDYNYFITVFRRLTGVPPKAYSKEKG